MAATISEIAAWIRENDDFALMAHIRADGDSLGSTLAMRLALMSMGKRACVVYPENYPAMYRFLPGTETITDENSLPFEPKSVIVIDVAEPVRLGLSAKVFERVENRCVIDHHEVKNCMVDRSYIRPEASAAGLLVYELIRELEVPITKDIAVCLYTAVSTDTGNFNFGNTTSEALRCCADCLETGIDVSALTRVLFRLRSPQRLKLLGMGVEDITYLAGGKLAFRLITEEMIRKAGAVHADTDRIVQFLMDAEGVEIAILAEEIEAGTKFSFRAIGNADVSELAGMVGGGGHKNASGATVKLPPEQAVPMVLDIVVPVAEAIGK